MSGHRQYIGLGQMLPLFLMPPLQSLVSTSVTSVLEVSFKRNMQYKSTFYLLLTYLFRPTYLNTGFHIVTLIVRQSYNPQFTRPECCRLRVIKVLDKIFNIDS